jgi:hypothetical protein
MYEGTGVMTKEQIMNMSKDELFSVETIVQAFEEASQVDRTLLLNALIDKAKEYKSAREMQSLIKAMRTDLYKAANSAGKNNELCRMTDFGRPEGEMLCGGWIANQESIWIPTLVGEQTACFHPILPIARLKNMQTNTEKLTLTFKRDGYWRDITVDKAITVSASKILKLADYGVMVTSETAKALVRYLIELESYNDLPLYHSTSKFGWMGKEFIPFDQDVVFDDESKFKELSNSLIQCGSYAVWLDLVKRIRQNRDHYEPQIYMSAAFASVLVSKLNLLPFITNIWGKTGAGKTVALMIACSIYADPSEGKYITDSYSTQNAFEIRLDVANHLPLMMDDLSKVRDKLGDNFTDLIYLLCSGRGKDRSNIDLGLNKVKTWQNTILTNMERPLANETMRGGAINRILDFQMKPGHIFTNGNAVVETIKDNYGHAGREFVELVKTLGVDFIGNIRKEFEQLIKDEAAKQESVKEEKQILPLSLILTADKLATDYIFKDGIYLDVAELVAQLKDVDEVSENERAYQAIIDTVSVNSQKFDPDENYKGEVWGFIKDGYVNIVPLIFRRMAESENYSVKGVCEWLKENNLLKHNDKNQNKVRVGTITRRYYTIKLPSEDDTEEEQFHKADDQELPFD